MSETQLNAELEVRKWEASYFEEYVRNSGFLPYMSSSTNAIIALKEGLTGGGNTLTISLVTRLKGDGVGTGVLEGNEEELGNYGHSITIKWHRNAVVVTDATQHGSPIGMRRAARGQLNVWSSSLMRKHIIEALASKWLTVGEFGAPSSYADATEAQKDQWLGRNADRVLFGDARGNAAGNDHSASLAAITAEMKLSASIVSLMKRMAKKADPHIRPTRVDDGQGREWFVLFADSMAFRDLNDDPVIQMANREARVRDMEKNPIFQGGDLVYDGVIIREIPEIESIGAVGAEGAQVSPVYLCGAQALGVAWAKRPTSTTDVRDYNFRHGVGIAEARGVNKLVFNGVDHGLVTGYVAAPDDV